ncbi:MAG: choice-of-anchor tandem repeat GloVer-containing protein [Bryobacteraceae bacterium]
MKGLRVSSISAASVLACVRLASTLAIESALTTLCAQSPVIYSFTGSTTDGANPHRAVVINAGGTLYGTTVYGGSSNDGVVYKLVPSSGTWTETVLHSFAGATSDGSAPDGDLVLSGTSIYGTTSAGGSSSDGTVFQEKNSSGIWTESILYNFAGGTGDGAGPFAGVIVSGGNLYGTTFYGGSSGDGTAYSLSPGTPWTESLLYSFGGTAGDGQNPHAALVYAGSGVYYGTTYNGGASGYGTVYQLTDSGGTWTETVLYSFSGGTDGSNPHSALIIDSSGNLYGTTVLGGAHSKGTIYKLTSGGGGSWTESVLYSFSGGSDGAIPRAGVVFGSSQSTLYGATTLGGGSANCTNGCGTVYKLVLSGGSWTVLRLQ